MKKIWRILAMVFLAIAVLLWMSSSGQFDDLEGPAHHILLDDDRASLN